MSGVEFRLGAGDHLVVEDFLASRPAGLSGIIVDAKNLKIQADAITAAKAADVDVYVEPLTERLVAEGYPIQGMDYGHEVIDPVHDLADTTSYAKLVEAVATPQVEVGVSAVTPPHFYAETSREIDRNVELTRQTIELYGLPVRPILAVKRLLLDRPEIAREVASDYVQLGVRSLDLRLSPLGGEKEGPAKIRSVLRILRTFRDAGLQMVVGSQGAIGETALALSLISGFSVGVGYREKYNHKEAIRRQVEIKQQKDRGDHKSRGPIAGIRLTSGQLTVSRKIGRTLYEDRTLRLRLRCSIGECAERIDGPIRDPRSHYLHARARDVDEILKQPEPWRPMLHRDRLVIALDLRKALTQHLQQEIPTRTLESLLSEIDAQMDAAA